ncbi:MAG: tyrosine-type recombinase/integrase [Deltaproteobacteria bacterium]|jgi:integrase|nr:tyrosine-type recombinase/integrase [Deltaproteobacteria bacterium]
MKTELSEAFLKKVEPNGRRQSFFDTRVPGLELRVGARGHRSFYVFYRFGKGGGAPLRRYHLGSYPVLTVSSARKMAISTLSRTLRGEDPAMERRRDRESATVGELIGKFMREYVEARTKPSTRKTYANIINKHIVPALGKIRVTALSGPDLTRLHSAMSSTPYAANRATAILKTFLNWAEENGCRPSGRNPARQVRPYKEEKRLDCMGPDQLARVGEAMTELVREGKLAPAAESAIKILMLTGARKNEILTLKREDIDFANLRIRLLDSKTGFKIIRLPMAAAEILSGIAREEGTYVFPGRGGKSHLSDLKHPWKRVLEKAAIGGRWRIHDLRHAFASEAVNAGASLPLIGCLLGHRNSQTTARYAHISQTSAAELAERTGESISRFISGESKKS